MDLYDRIKRRYSNVGAFACAIALTLFVLFPVTSSLALGAFVSENPNQEDNKEEISIIFPSSPLEKLKLENITYSFTDNLDKKNIENSSIVDNQLTDYYSHNLKIDTLVEATNLPQPQTFDEVSETQENIVDTETTNNDSTNEIISNNSSDSIDASDEISTDTEPNNEEDFSWITGDSFNGLTNDEKIDLVAKMAIADMNKTGILASVTIAQSILESGWFDSSLAKKNNVFGMKAVISHNTWEGTTWDGSTVNKETGEEYHGEHVTIKADFRTYPNIWLSIQDHSAYLLNAKTDDGNYRYEGIAFEKDPKKVVAIIANGGYATSSDYSSSVLSLIERYDLTRFDS